MYDLNLSMQPNGYAIPQTMPHVQYDYGSPVTTASTMAAGQPQYNQHPLYIQNQGYADPNQQIMYQPTYQHPAYIQTDPHLYTQMGQVVGASIENSLLTTHSANVSTTSSALSGTSVSASLLSSAISANILHAC